MTDVKSALLILDVNAAEIANKFDNIIDYKNGIILINTECGKFQIENYNDGCIIYQVPAIQIDLVALDRIKEVIIKTYGSIKIDKRDYCFVCGFRLEMLVEGRIHAEVCEKCSPYFRKSSK